MRLSDRYAEALRYSFDLHREQTRKGSGIPYFAHLIGVSSLVLEHGGDEDAAIAALLHDAAEDQGGRAILAEIEARFGAMVSAIVEACSDSLETPKPAWQERKRRYIEHLSHAAYSAQLVAACDKLYNARTIRNDYRQMGEDLWSRFSGGREGVLWYYAALADALTLDNPVVAELKRTVQDLRDAAAARAKT
jgi:GTP pyrophosphokinase